jgi:hypothetical protein
VGTDLAYALDQDFDLIGQLKPLSLLEADLPDSVVRGAFQFTVASAPHTRGVLIKPVAGSRVTAPLKQRKTEPECEEDEGQVDVEEDLYSDLSSECVVDTDVDSGIADSDDADDDEPIKPIAAPGSDDGAKVEPCKAMRTSRTHHWRNGYFYISEPAKGEGWRI